MSRSISDIVIAELEQQLDMQNLPASLVNVESHQGDTAKINLRFGFPSQQWQHTLIPHLTQALQQQAGINHCDIIIKTAIKSHAVQQGLNGLDGVKNVIAIASGKGGVGKSTTAVNVALALAAEGAHVGILDADIYGPSQPHMLGAQGEPDSPDGKTVSPVIAHGLQSMSIGYLIAKQDQAMIWRGPMVSGALQQLVTQTVWDNLDYLIIDLPPGTGDIQLTMAQKIPVSGAVIVSTPQDIALLDAKKAVQMFNKVKVPVLGIVENMSTHICSQCGHEEAIFGADGGEQMAHDYNLAFLGKIPLHRHIREQTDQGKPTVVADPESPLSAAYHRAALRIVALLSLQARDYASKFPKIVVENQ